MTFEKRVKELIAQEAAVVSQISFDCHNALNCHNQA
jgi:hypothetical protein